MIGPRRLQNLLSLVFPPWLALCSGAQHPNPTKCKHRKGFISELTEENEMKELWRCGQGKGVGERCGARATITSTNAKGSGEGGPAGGQHPGAQNRPWKGREHI